MTDWVAGRFCAQRGDSSPIDVLMPAVAWLGEAPLVRALVASALLRRWPLAPLWVAFGLCSALSRLYVGMHYPSDVVAGLAVGAGVVVVVEWVGRPASLTGRT